MDARSPRHSRSSAGFILIYLVMAMALIAALAAGVMVLSTSSATGQVETGRQLQAMHLAQAGVDYAKAHKKAWFTDMATKGGMSFDLGGSGLFMLQVANNGDGTFDVASTGISGQSTPFEANYETHATGYTPEDDSGTPGDPSDEYPTPTEVVDYTLFTSDTPLSVSNQGTVDGSVAGASVTLGNQVEVTGSVRSESTVRLINHSSIGGNICAADDVFMENHTEVDGEIHTQGDLEVGSNEATVHGSVYVAGNVILRNSARIMGDVHAGGDVELGSNNSLVAGNIYSGGNVILNNAATVVGDVHAAGNINVNWGGTIEGDAIAGGTVTVNSTGGQVNGSRSPRMPSPPRIMPKPPKACGEVTMPKLQTFFSDPGNNVTIGWDKDSSKPLAPGTYGALTLGGQNRLYLSSGDECADPCASSCVDYVFSSVSAGTQPDLFLDLSGTDGACNPDNPRDFLTILVSGDVTWGDGMTIQVSCDGKNYKPFDAADPKLAALVYIESHGSFTLKNQSPWFGTILTKNNLTFVNQTKLIGSYHTLDGTADTGNQPYIKYVKSVFADQCWD
ncbi:polymer-forming cytoskeletal protein [Desulfocurvibacter africanus]|uniref:polymer-forming cytoskeletal protein n=1 Tax=Desulfocurvibacter africanus TaxID=873 RepID=UPI002FD9C85E